MEKGDEEGKKENCKKEGGKLKMEGGKSSKMRAISPGEREKIKFIIKGSQLDAFRP